MQFSTDSVLLSSAMSPTVNIRRDLRTVVYASIEEIIEASNILVYLKLLLLTS